MSLSPKVSDSSLTRRLLEDGRTVNEPDATEREELTRLEGLGLLSLTWSETFLCVDHQDDADLVYAHDRLCNHRMLVRPAHPDDPSREGDDREYECEACGRLHWPRRRGRTLYPRVRVEVSLKAVASWVQGQLERVADGVQRLPGGGSWRFFHGDEEVYVVLLDAELDGRYATEAFARAHPVLYVVLDHRGFSRRFVEADWLRVVFLHELAHRGHIALRERLDEPWPEPMLCREPAAKPWLPVRTPEVRVARRVLGMHRLELASDHATLDGHVVVPPEADAMLDVLRFFAARWREDLVDGKSLGNHCSYSPDEVLEDLEERGVARTEAPCTVRRQINRLRQMIARRYVEATGIDAGVDGIVERVEGRGGFRLNAQKVMVAR